MQLFAGSPPTNFRQASRPPAEAPIPTTAKSFRPRGGLRASEVRLFGRIRAPLAFCGRLPGMGKLTRRVALKAKAPREITTHSGPRRRSRGRWRRIFFNSKVCCSESFPTHRANGGKLRLTQTPASESKRARYLLSRPAVFIARSPRFPALQSRKRAIEFHHVMKVGTDLGHPRAGRPQVRRR